MVQKSVAISHDMCTHVGGPTILGTLDDVSLRLDTIPALDRQTEIHDNVRLSVRLCYCVHIMKLFQRLLVLRSSVSVHFVMQNYSIHTKTVPHFSIVHFDI